jgi:hypothetical protein
VQIRLPEHTYGVIFTKTTGYHQQVIKPGTFVWKWERLIPTNFTMHRFTIEPQTIEVSQQGTLPSGEVYAGALEENPDFSYRLEFTLSFELRPEQLPALVEEDALTPENLDQWYEGRSQAILSVISSFVSRRVEELDSVSPPQLQPSELEEMLLKELQEDFPMVEFSSITPRHLTLPDFKLYYTAREHYFDLLETRKTTERRTLERSRSWMVSEESKLEVLQKYGELFTEYPGLIRYLALKDQKSIENMVPQIELLENVFGRDGELEDAGDVGAGGEQSAQGSPAGEESAGEQ